jgi:hypothetical protein
MSLMRGAVTGALKGVIISLLLGLVGWVFYAVWGTLTYGGLAELRNTELASILFGFLLLLSWLWWYPLLGALLGSVLGAWRGMSFRQ